MQRFVKKLKAEIVLFKNHIRKTAGQVASFSLTAIGSLACTAGVS